jgi:hypothetical protein
VRPHLAVSCSVRMKPAKRGKQREVGRPGAENGPAAVSGSGGQAGVEKMKWAAEEWSWPKRRSSPFFYSCFVFPFQFII